MDLGDRRRQLLAVAIRGLGERHGLPDLSGKEWRRWKASNKSAWRAYREERDRIMNDRCHVVVPLFEGVGVVAAAIAQERRNRSEAATRFSPRKVERWICNRLKKMSVEYKRTGSSLSSVYIHINDRTLRISDHPSPAAGGYAGECDNGLGDTRYGRADVCINDPDDDPLPHELGDYPLKEWKAALNAFLEMALEK